MPGVRAKDKGRIEGWLPLSLLKRVRGIAADDGLNDTALLHEALTEWADSRDPSTPQTEEHQQ